MDVCAFVGVAPRGPARIPKLSETWSDGDPVVDPNHPRRRSVAVPVESWDEYKQFFGGFEGPGRLPYAVASYFEQGGRKAYIVRVVHQYATAAENTAGVARGKLPGATVSLGTLRLHARDEGHWGNFLRAALGFSVTPIGLLPGTGTAELIIDASDLLPVGSLLHLSLPETAVQPAQRVLRFVSAIHSQGEQDRQTTNIGVTLDIPVDVTPDFVELIEGDLKIIDGQGLFEHFKGLGLSARHPRWMAKVLFAESRLVYPDHSWVDGEIRPLDPDTLPTPPSLDDPHTSVGFSDGRDRYDDITFDDFFDERWTLGDPEPGDGVYALTHLADLASVVVPDLYVPKPLPGTTKIEAQPSLAGGRFKPCVTYTVPDEEIEAAVPELSSLYLNPDHGGDLEEIIKLQEKLAVFADRLSNFVVLLDTPPGLSQKKILRWRSRFRSSYVAAYYPWLQVSNREDRRNALIPVNPSAVAAGIIARQEHQFGVPHGPANVIAHGVVKVDEIISAVQHDELHPQGINVFLAQRDGVWLSAGRTLSRDSRYRQLSIRRLMLMLRRTLAQQMQWAVFEPNGPALWAEVRSMLNSFLRRLFAKGAFRGNSEEDAFFVRCDEVLNSRRMIDAGRMIAEVGVAPAEPLEFIVLRITRGGDGTLIVES
jgi:hypothetical protein